MRPRLRWDVVTTEDELSRWAISADLIGIFAPELLSEPTVRFLVVRNEQGPSAGAIVDRTGATVGLSNVFTTAISPDALWVRPARVAGPARRGFHTAAGSEASSPCRPLDRLPPSHPPLRLPHAQTRAAPGPEGAHRAPITGAPLASSSATPATAAVSATSSRRRPRKPYTAPTASATTHGRPTRSTTGPVRTGVAYVNAVVPAVEATNSEAAQLEQRQRDLEEIARESLAAAVRTSS